MLTHADVEATLSVSAISAPVLGSCPVLTKLTRLSGYMGHLKKIVALVERLLPVSASSARSRFGAGTGVWALTQSSNRFVSLRQQRQRGEARSHSPHGATHHRGRGALVPRAKRAGPSSRGRRSACSPLAGARGCAAHRGG